MLLLVIGVRVGLAGQPIALVRVRVVDIVLCGARNPEGFELRAGHLRDLRHIPIPLIVVRDRDTTTASRGCVEAKHCARRKVAALDCVGVDCRRKHERLYSVRVRDIGTRCKPIGAGLGSALGAGTGLVAAGPPQGLVAP